MILELLLLAGLGVAHAQDDEGETDPLSPYRTPFGVLAERTIGTTSRPVEFNWRRTQVQVAASGDFLFELNNFDSVRAGGLVRLPRQGVLYELGLSYTWVWDTPSSELLALTPYRQPGRPERVELDFDVGIPLAEGLVTARPRFVPALEMVFMGYVGLRYSVYPGSFTGMKAREVGAALLSPALTDTEVENLDEERLDAMEVDTGRYGVMVGLGDDLYFRQGLFVSPRVMFGLPLLAPASGTELYFWGNFSLVLGVAF